MDTTNTAPANPLLVEWIDSVIANPQGRTVEELLGIQEWIEESLAVEAQAARERVIEETDTRNERALPGVEAQADVEVSECDAAAFLSWDAPASPMAEAFALAA